MSDRPIDIEEERLSEEVPQRIVRHGGLLGAAESLGKELRAAGSPEEAADIVRGHGRALWRNAVRRLRETDGDDRPLYWSRLALRRTVAEVAPELAGELERSSRGLGGNGLPAGEDRLRIVVTGFDPFRLEKDIRRGNPSGSAALALHGTTLRTSSGRTAHIEAMVLPVRWADFSAGLVEDALRPYLEPGPRGADLFMTISQGRPGRFDLERFNGAWRGGGPDNTGEEATGLIPVSQEEQPQWTSTTLPYAELTAAETGRFPVHDRTEVTEIPAGGGEPVERAEGPSAGSAARRGGGGDYLSNEIAYRATLLRDALEADVPGGHLHTPALEFGPENTDLISDPVLVANRQAITGQIRALLGAAAETLS